jgi:light-harvesting protein B-800-850 alpha chain
MNQGRIWCVVSPTLGLPLFLGSVAVTSLIVHFAVLNNTTWFGNYLNGKTKAKVAVEESSKPLALSSSDAAAGFTISVAPARTADDKTAFVITLAPKAGAVAQADVSGASLPTTVALAPATEK